MQKLGFHYIHFDQRERIAEFAQRQLTRLLPKFSDITTE